VGAFGGCNILTTSTLGAGASTLGTVSCTTVTTNNSNITVGSGSITSGQHNPTTSATYDLGAFAIAWKSAYLSSNLTVGGAITGSNGLTVSGGTVSLPTGSVVNAAIASGLHAAKITTGTFGVGAFGGCNILTAGTLGAGASTLGTVSCTTVTTNNSNITVGSGSITSGQHNPTTTATVDLGASGTAWRSAYLSSNLMVGGAITGSNGLTLPGQYTCSLPVTFDTVANGVKDIATFTCTSTTSGQISFDILVILSQSDTSVTKRYMIITGYAMTGGSWQRCVPVSAYAYSGVTNNYELQVQSVSLPSPAAIKLRLVHSVNSVASTPTVNITATYAENDVPTFANLTANAQYTDASWATYGFVTSTALTQVGGQVGVGTLAPSAKFHVSGGSAQFDSNVTVTSALSTSNLTATGTVSLPNSSLAAAAIAGTLATTNIPNLSASNLNTETFSVGTFGTAVVPSSSATYDLGASGTTWRSAFLSSNLTVGAALTASSTVSVASTLSCSGPISVPKSDPGYLSYTNYQSFSAPLSSNTNGDIYGYGQWVNGTSRAVIAGVLTSGATFNVSKPSGTNFTGFTDMLRVVSSDGNVGINNTSPTNRLDVGGTLHTTGTVTFNSNMTVSGTTSIGNLTSSNITTTGLVTLSSPNQDKIIFTNVENGSKIRHDSGWVLGYYAGQSNASTGSHQWNTGTATG
jgi:hypothetical protein